MGDFYASCMDQAAIDAAGLKPIAGDLDRVAAAASKEDLLRVMGALRRDGLSTLFTFGVGADLKDSTKTLMNVDQGGTSLPERDYYLKDDPKNVETREQYVAHMTRMFTLGGRQREQAAARAKSVLALETRLAAAQLDRVGRRDPNNRDHRDDCRRAGGASCPGSTSPATSPAPRRPPSPKSTSAGRSSSRRSTPRGARPRSTT